MMEPSSKNSVNLSIIGHIHTPFKEHEKLPIQGTANTARGTLALLPEYHAGLKDIDGFDRIWLLYFMPADTPAELVVVPRLDDQPRGVFAARSRQRPNPIGLTCVRITRVEGHTVHIEGVDMLDGSPLLDIKPYVPRYDAYPDAWSGWLENAIPHEEAWRQKTQDQQ